MAWLDLTQGATGWSLVDTGRMNEIVQDMSHPATQYSSLISFVGNYNRMLALRSLFPHNNVLRRSSAGVIRLHLSIITAHNEYPIWFAESRLQDLPAVGECPKALWKDDRTKSLLEALQSRTQAGASSAPARMRVIVVLTKPTAVYKADPVEVLQAVWSVTDPDHVSLSVIDLRGRYQLSGPALFAPLQWLVQDCLTTMGPALTETEFRPDHVFDTLYRDLWGSAWRTVGEPDGSGHSDAIRSYFAEQFSRISLVHTSRAIRQDELIRFGRRWSALTLPTACVVCLGRWAEHQTSCRHGICDTCVTMFGQRTRGVEYHRDLAQCPLCQGALQLTVRQLPPTKRPVVLALDGGGIRGMVTLGLLRALEQRLAGAITLPEIPDLTVGTSVANSPRAGSVIGTDQVYNNTSAAEACRRFPDLAQCIFQPGYSLSRIWPWLGCILNLVRDGAYDSGALERTLQQVCQPGRRVFDVMPPVAAGRRLAIVASRTSDGKPVVFPNYRGVRHRAVDSAYQRIVSHGASQNPLLRKAFFRSKHLSGIGVLQDGGVRCNDPHGIAQEECRNIWPSAQTHDLLVSVGTGYVPPAEEGTDPAQHGCSSLQDKAPFRLWRAYNSSPCMDGVEAFKEELNHVPHPLRTRIFRLDHALADLPRLDDVMRAAELAKKLYTVPDELVRAVLATCFFFELDEGPTRTQGQYLCRGSVLCARREPRRILERVLVEFPGPELQTGRGEHLGRSDDDDGCIVCGYYRKKVRFHVASLDEELSIMFKGSSGQQPIGGFPATVRQFLHLQQSDAVFGRSDHQIDQWPPQRMCYCPRGVKRVRFAEPAPSRKKRRV
ncbi:FabD/lysophospholipase-like protein [Aspergillus niger CBS 101883]|uniref:FabD/lysophospholipase-like protein n=1 Tax=Aspergillus lacticoffeatus (strain CBS 101883) TaxID=1450533 RepID=UPI000D7FABAC|nr:FabD/lysophospholipase-like protein [Aspergillus niger CBS 101883]PYH50940.1 FabD/lysophospholipase-like protein [Aspergillus niger CBS 101883]